MADIPRLLQAFVSPAIFVSAAALMLLSLNVRLMGIVGRLRQIHREKHAASQAGRVQEAQALAEQIPTIEQRAEKIRKAFLFTLLCAAGTVLTCLLLGMGLYWPAAQTFAAAVFVVAILCLLVGTLFYISEILVALSSVRDEAKYFHLIDLGVRRSAAEEEEERRTRAF